MNQLHILLAQPACRALGDALVESTWQLALVGSIYVGARLAVQSPSIRYWLGLATMLVMLVLPASSVLTRTLDTQSRTSFTAASDSAENSQPRARRGPTEAATPSKLIDRVRAWVTLLWLMGTSFCSLRVAHQYLGVRLILWRHVRPVGNRWRSMVQEYTCKFGIRRRIRVLETTRVGSPATVGWLRPVVLVPASTMVGLPPSYLETVLLHELAHVRRWDYALNLFQSVVEVLLFYHPMVWWVSAQVRLEREHCCDDDAVAVLGDKITYARALSELEQHRSGRVPAGALAATGGSLMKRIRRVLGLRPVKAGRGRKAAGQVSRRLG